MALWKPINGFEAIYEVSSEGRVRRVLKTGARKEISQKETNGYRQVCLWQGGSPHWKMVHRLVVEAFLAPIKPGFEVNHKNGVRSDNAVANLESVTRSENCIHRHRALNCPTNLKPMRGEKNGSSKLSEEAVVRIRNIRDAEGLSYAKLADRFGITPRMAWLIVKRKAWGHI